MDDFFFKSCAQSLQCPYSSCSSTPASLRPLSLGASSRGRHAASNWAVRRGYITYFIVHSSQVATHASYTKLAITMHMPTPMPLPATPNAELILGGEHTTPSLACSLSHVFIV